MSCFLYAVIDNVVYCSVKPNTYVFASSFTVNSQYSPLFVLKKIERINEFGRLSKSMYSLFNQFMRNTVRVEIFAGGLFLHFMRVIPNPRILILGTKCNGRGFNT